MKTANYYNRGGSKNLFVLKEHGNRTVDLGLEDGTVIVSNCPVKHDYSDGSCVIVGPEPKPKEPEGKYEKTSLPDLRKHAEKIGVDHKDLDKPALITAIVAKESEPQ